MSANAEIALLLPTNEQQPVKCFPDTIPDEDWTLENGHMARKYTKGQIKRIEFKRKMVETLFQANFTPRQVADKVGLPRQVIERLHSKLWERVTHNPKEFTQAVRQAGAKYVSLAMPKADEAPFRDLMNAAVGLIGKANDMEALNQMGQLSVNDNATINLVESNPTQDTTPDRIRRLLFKARSQAGPVPVQDPLVVCEQSKVSSTVTVSTDPHTTRHD